MKTTNEQEKHAAKSKRVTWTIDPPDDLERMMERALLELGASADETRGLRSRILVDCARIGMVKKGFARKKDLAA